MNECGLHQGHQTWIHLVFLQNHHCDTNLLHKKCPLKTGKTGLALPEIYILSDVRKCRPRLQTVQGKDRVCSTLVGAAVAWARLSFSMQ